MAAEPSDRLKDAKRRWSLTGAALIAETPTSFVYRVTQADGTNAALKLLTERGAEELTGAAYLDWCDGSGAARLLELAGQAMLIEWLDGPSLGDIARSGDISGSVAVIAGLLPRLQASDRVPPKELMPLERRFDALLMLEPAQLGAPFRCSMQRAQALARLCLAESRGARPLHGDLHHDNIMQSHRGWLTFDPKGVLGDPAYDVANLFQNPVGAPELAQNPKHHRSMAERFAPILDVSEARIRHWAAAHAGLSVAWDIADGVPLTAGRLAPLEALLAAL